MSLRGNGCGTSPDRAHDQEVWDEQVRQHKQGHRRDEHPKVRVPEEVSPRTSALHQGGGCVAFVCDGFLQSRHDRAAAAPLRCGIVGRVEPIPGPRSDRFGEFGKRSGDPRSGRGVDGEFVVAAVEVLQEGVSGDDHLRCLVRP